MRIDVNGVFINYRLDGPQGARKALTADAAHLSNIAQAGACNRTIEAFLVQ